jgi:hypothetical protein
MTVQKTGKTVVTEWLHLLTYSMEQSPWEPNWFAASQEIHRILWNPKVHHHIQKWLNYYTILKWLFRE